VVRQSRADGVRNVLPELTVSDRENGPNWREGRARLQDELIEEFAIEETELRQVLEEEDKVLALLVKLPARLPEDFAQVRT